MDSGDGSWMFVVDGAVDAGGEEGEGWSRSREHTLQLVHG